MATHNASASASSEFAGSLTFALTVGGVDRYLIIAVAAHDSRTITGVTHNSVGLTAIESAVAYYRLYGLVAPATGTHDVVVSLDGPESVAAVASAYTGVDQSTPYDGLQTGTTGDAAPSVTVTSASGNLVVGAAASLDATGQSVPTAGADQTSRGSLAGGPTYLIQSDEPGAASVVHSYTRNGAFYYQQRNWGLNLRAAAGPPPGSAVPAKMNSYRQRRF